ncbi:(2Fe-2S)-binding protein [Calothrix sp. HK-06]|nr:(2Fe-2S)-binding protein [Calothrix sp. HK-06]
MSWTKVLAQDELSGDTRKVVKVEKRSILLLNHNNQIYAIENSCPHLNLPLKNGKITEDGSIVCPFHRSAFDLTTGQPSKWIPFPPGIGKLMGMISTEKGVAVFPTRIEEGSIWIDV